jgi:HlyD family secretion protein
MRRFKVVLLAVVLPLVLLGGGGAMVARRMRPKPKPLRTAKVERGDVVVAVRETGIVEPDKQVEVKSKVAGQLAELAVEAGDFVKKGDLIARLTVPEVEAQRDQVRAQLDAARARLRQARLTLEQNPTLIESQITQAEASLRAAEAALEEAQARRKDAERVHENKRRLFEMGGYVSQNEVDTAQSAIDVARHQEASAAERVSEQQAALTAARARQTEVALSRARVTEAEAAVRQIQDSLTEIESRLGDAVIRAPCSGVILSRLVREGEVITAVSYYGSGAPLVIIGDVSTMLVKVNLNEVDIAKVALGQTVEVKADALRDRSFKGRVSRIAPASAAQSGVPGQDASIVRFPVEVTVMGDHSGLKPGMTANVEIACKSARGVLWVPNDAVFEKNGKHYVAVPTGRKDRKGQEKAEDRRVETGLINDMRTEITSGLKAGEKVELGKSGIPERKKINIQQGDNGGD